MPDNFGDMIYQIIHNKVFDLYKGNIPSSIRMFLSTIAGDRSEITEKDFSPKELEILRSASQNVLARGERVIGYGDYGEKEPFAEGNKAVLNALTDPAQSLAFTLGMARVSQAPELGINIQDKYHFAANRELVRDTMKEKTFLGMLQDAYKYNGLLGVGNLIGNLSVPQGEGRAVNINIPGPKANMRSY